MEKIKFHIDVKQTIWVREFHEVEFESKEALRKKLEQMSYKPKFNADDVNDELSSFLEQETLFETTDYLPVEENDGYSTVEVYFDEGEFDIVAQNGK